MVIVKEEIYGFYFTYEELKQLFWFTDLIFTFSFYFTYEELKLLSLTVIACGYWVFTLPMRNWNAPGQGV